MSSAAANPGADQEVLPPQDAAVTMPHRHRRRRPKLDVGAQAPLGDSLRWRLTLSVVGLLIVAGAILLFFVNAAARLATVPVETQHFVDPVTGFVDSQQYVDLNIAQARQQTLDRLRFYSIIGFALLIVVGLGVAWIVSGRALRPIGQSAAVARRISGSNLKERIDLGGPQDELKMLADSFDAMVERLDDAFERQRRFVADASHELRTPLTALQLGIDTVRRDPQADVGEYRRAVDDAAEATWRMRRLVEDLLTLAAADDAPARSPVDLSSLAEAVVEEVEPIAERKGVGLIAAVPAGVRALAEPSSVRRALRNLAENAVRYTDMGGQVRVEAADAPIGYVAIAVVDNGIGIPEDHLDRIFERFHRVDTGRSRLEGGSGLGLSIVARIAAQAQGSVRVESRVGEGSRFILTLPAPPPILPVPPGSLVPQHL